MRFHNLGGEWCGVCINMQRVKLRLPRYQKAERAATRKGAGVKLLKEDLRRNPEAAVFTLIRFKMSCHGWIQPNMYLFSVP